MKPPFCHRGREITTACSFRVLVGGLALLAFCALLIATRRGIGLSSDSLVYIGVARSLLDGHGVTYLNDIGEFSPVNHYPPLYPSMIAGSALMGMDPLLAAKWMNAFFFAGNVILVSAIALASTRSYGASVAAAIFVFTSFPMVQIHSMAWSEPIFVFFGFFGLFLLALYLQGSKRWMLYGAASSIALACLARYAGIAFVWTGVFGVFFLAPRGRKKPLADAIVFSTLSSLPLAAWAFRSVWLAGSAANRTLGFHPPGGEDLITALNSLCLWFFPSGIFEVPVSARLAGLGMGLFLVLRFAGHKGFPNTRYDQLAGSFLLAYGIFIFTARSFFDTAITFDTRILAPAYVAAMVLVVAVVAPWMKTKVSRGLLPARFISFCLVVAVTATQATTGLAWWKHGYAKGIGFASSTWSNSEALQFVNAAGPSRTIFTNAPDVIYMLTGRHTAMIPRKVDPKSRMANGNYPIEIATMKEQLKKTHGVVVYFDAEQRLWYLPSASELQKDAALRLLARKKDGTIYRLDGSR
jgi:4-amino-4-deoxy-L-arabinose transferase-like glycosyltransferase